MHHQGGANPEPAQGSQRPRLRGPGAEVLRLTGYPVKCWLTSGNGVAARA
jgi:hypothetical protein